MRFVLMTLGGLAIFFFLLACVQPSEPATPELSTPILANPTPASKAPVPGTKVESGTFVLLWSDPPTLDPHQANDIQSNVILVESFGGLVSLDTDLTIVPDVAEKWTVTEDGRKYTFLLREDVKFHDGRPVTAQDFKWSLERAADVRTLSMTADQYLGDIVGVKSKLRGKASEINGVHVVDKYTLEVTIDGPKAYFLAKLTYPASFVLDQRNVESSKQWFLQPNGTGPFKLTEYSPGERLTLERNDSYHLGPPRLDRVQFLLSGGTPMLMYENDEIHMTGVGLADLDRLLDESHPLHKELHKAPPSFSTSYLGMNVKKPPFDDPKVRLALNYAINRKEISSLVLADLVVPAKGILPPGFPAYNSGLKGYQYDPDKAMQLLKESRYGGDLDKFPRITLTTPGAFGATVSLDMEVILEAWRTTLGIDVRIQQVEFATFLRDLQRRRLQLFEVAWMADYPDPENFLDLLFHGDSNINHTGYNNANVNRLLEKARIEQDHSKRITLYQETERQILEETPWIPLWHAGERYQLIKPSVKGYYLTPMYVPKLRHVYLDD